MDKPAMVMGAAVVGALLTLLVLRVMAPLELAMQDVFFQTVPCPESGSTTQAGDRRCGYFPLAADPFWQVMRDIGFKGPLIVVGLGSLYYLWPRAKAAAMTPARLAPLVVAASTLWVGSIGLINFGIKPLFGRPRPKHLDLFGRFDSYVLPGTPSGQCSVNCSFTSGEAATALAMVFFALLLPRPWRWVGVTLALVVAVLIGVLRVGFGGHFLSDVVMAWWTIILVALATAWWLQSPSGARFLDTICARLNKLRGNTVAQF